MHGLEINIKKKPCLAASNKGFLSIYALMLLSLSLTFITLIQSKYTTAMLLKKDKREGELVELYAIHYVKTALKEYEEKDETITYRNHEIQITYEDITAFIVYKLNGVTHKIVVEYDDICDCIMNIAYIK